MKNFYRKRCKRVFKFNILPLLLAMIMTVGIFLPCSNYVYASEDIDDIVIGDDADTEISDEPSTLDYQEYTALTYTDSSMDNLSDDVSVYLMGELPVGGYAIAYPLDLPIQTDISDCLFFTYDITVYNSDGTPFEPDDPIKVSIVLPDLPYDIQDCSLSLVYIPENGEPEMLDTPVTILDGEVTFDVEHFSAYSVVVTGATKNGAGEVVAVKVDDKVVGNLGNDSNPNVNVNAISTYFGEVHSFTFAIFPTTVTPNLTLTELYQGPDMSSLGNNLIPSPVDAPFSETFSFTDDNVVVAKYTVVSTSGTKNIVLSINITVTNPDTDLGIQNTIAQDGLLDAIMDTNNVTDNVVSYIWSKSDSSGGPYTQVDDDSLANNGASVNVAYDNGGLMWYKAEAIVDDGNGGTYTITSAPYQVPYAAKILNGGFDQPAVAGDLPGGYKDFLSGSQMDPNFINGDTDLMWKTTASDGQVEIGYAKTYRINGTQNRVAELNGEVVGTLYQDLLVMPGETLYWSLSHTGRTGNDSMNVVIMPTGKIDPNLTSAEAANITSTADGSIQVTNIVDPNSVNVYPVPIDKGWNLGNNENPYTGSYVVPDGVYLVRFFFVSVFTYSGNQAQGNIIDNIEVSTDMPYSIEYYENGSLVATESGRGAFGDIITAQNTGNYSAYTFLQSLLTQKDSTGVTPAGGKDLELATSFILKNANSVLKLYYVSSGVFVNKTVSGVLAEDMPDIYNAVFTLYAYDDTELTDPLATATVTMEQGSVTGIAQFFDEDGDEFMLEPESEYNVVEDMYSVSAIDWYTYTGSLDNVINFTAPDGNEPYQVYFTNTYERNSVELTVAKTVTGDYADTGKMFNFTVYLKDKNGAPLSGSFQYTGSSLSGIDKPDDGILTFDTNGMATIKLKHGQGIDIKGIPQGSFAQIIEDDDFLYDTTFVDGDNPGTVEVGVDTGSLQLMTDKIFTFNNDRVIVPETGIYTGSTGSFIPIVVGSALALALFICFTVKKSLNTYGMRGRR